ncbi:MAG: hypothetical protein QME94_06550 [Anaerolineae bacterium]|nr:hypothetical protein [Anaerolineae bacterium]
MDGVISFAASGASARGAAGRQEVAEAAMRRYIPHTVAWCCAQAGEPISVTLPATLSAGELVRRAERERLRLSVVDDPQAPDQMLELHYAHLAEAEIDEGIRRLGYCLARYSELAARHTPGYPSMLLGT